MLVTKEIEIDMGHRVPNHKSKCRNLHGHRYKIELGCDDKVIDEEGASDEGMVIDFSDMKEVLMDVIDRKFDHGFVMYEKDNFAKYFKIMQGGEAFGMDNIEMPQKITFVPFIPTAENLCKYWYELLKPELAKRNVKIKHVKVWETPTSTAIYSEE